MKKTFANCFFIFALLFMSGCNNNSKASTGFSPEETFTLDNNNNDNETPAHITRETEMLASTLANDMESLWTKLKDQTYQAKVYDSKLRKKVTKSIRYLPKDVEMAYCFADKNNESLFSNHDPYKTGFEIASISKIFISLWALNARNDNYVLLPNRFVTNFSLNPKTGELFIGGSFDPLFGIDRMKDVFTKLRAQMKASGQSIVKTITKVTSANFLQLPIFTSEATYEIGVNETAAHLAQSPSLTNSNIIKVFTYLKKNKEPLLAAANLSKFEIKNVSASSIETYLNNPDFFRITSNQRPLNNFLLFMNSFSSNPGADLLYQLLGGRKEFVDFMARYMPANMTSTILHNHQDLNPQVGYDNNIPFAFYSGSGLPHVLRNSTDSGDEDDVIKEINYEQDEEETIEDESGKVSRKRNKATCEMIFNAMEGLDASESILNTKIEEILPINGMGTLRRSISSDVPKATFIGKTGSLNNLLSLAGLLKTKNGNRPFFLSFYRKNLDAHGAPRANGLTGAASTFVRSKVTTSFVSLMLKFYKNKEYNFEPDSNLLSLLNASTFLATSNDITNISAVQ